jgi:hypothetical protein
MLRKRVISVLIVNLEELIKKNSWKYGSTIFNPFHVHNLISGEMYALL